jgi:predicted Zn-dependent protease
MGDDLNRIERLRRQVRMNPASIAFAALADEYRRAGRHDDAVETCRLGLQRHPSYLTPRVTLARSLAALGRFDEARAELVRVLRQEPGNPAGRQAQHEIEALEMRALSSAACPQPDTNDTNAVGALQALEHFLAAVRRVRQSRREDGSRADHP